MTGALNRLRGMSRREIAWRLQTVARTHAQRAAFRAQRPAWRRARLRDALTPAAWTPELAAFAARRDWHGANGVLVDMLRRRDGRFLFDHRSMPALRRAVLARWPHAALDAAARADRMADGVYDLLGYRGLDYSSKSGIDWHHDPVHGRRAAGGFWADVPYLDPASGDHKVIWEINRHQHWLSFGRALWLTGETRFHNLIVQQLSSWLAANPPLTGVNWASMLELGFRSISWTSALHFLLTVLPCDFEAKDDPWLVDMLVALDRQLTHVEQNLSYYFSPNTHLTGEALALYVAGLALPELRRSAGWVEKGRAVLLAEIDRQVAPDGGHAERSTHYHRYTLDFYLAALLMARRCQDTEAERAFTAVGDRLARYLRAIADDTGWMPVIGDDDGGMLWPIAGRHHRDVRDSLALASVVLDNPSLAPWGITEEVFWLAWTTHAQAVEGAGVPGCGAAGVRTDVFPDTGYAVVRGKDHSHLVFDVGQHGYLNGGHAHADALAVTLSISGKPLLIDPGTATYTMDPLLRDRMRSSASHNTLTLNGHSPSVPAGPFHWRTRTDARLDAARRNPSFAWLEGAHDGYGSVQHRRSIVHGDGAGWLVVDEVLGHGRHDAQLHWHFDPAWDVTCEQPQRLRAMHADGTTAWVLSDVGGGSLWLMRGDKDAGIGWCSPSYGALQPTWTACRSRTAAAPFALATWVGAAEDAPTLTTLTPSCDAGGRGIGVRVCRDGLATVTLLRPGDTAHRDSRSCTIEDYQTNARLLQYTVRDGHLTTLSLADASHALALREGLLDVTADETIHDLHAALDGETLTLIASCPVPELRLHGEALAAVRRLLVNGQERSAARHGRDTLVVESVGVEAGHICAA